MPRIAQWRTEEFTRIINSIILLLINLHSYFYLRNLPSVPSHTYSLRKIQDMEKLCSTGHHINFIMGVEYMQHHTWSTA